MIMGKSVAICLNSERIYLCVTVAGLIKYLGDGGLCSSA